jgi:hypothetical protein
MTNETGAAKEQDIIFYSPYAEITGVSGFATTPYIFTRCRPAQR